MSKNEKHEPFLDVSTLEASRKTLRRLLGFQAAMLVAGIGLTFFTTLPETVQTALALEDELVPQWRLLLGGLVTVAVLVLYVWGAVELWYFKRAGLTKYLWATFAPLFLVQATPSVSTGLMDFVYGVLNVLAGMILFMCVTIPSLFAQANDLSEVDATVPQGAGVTS
jgi:hypothetical protein